MPKPVVSSKSLTPPLLESTSISVSATSYPSVTYVHSLGLPPLTTVSTDNSVQT